MERVRVSLTESTVARLDALIEQGYFTTRDEALEAAVRSMVQHRTHQRAKKALDDDICWGLCED